MASIASTPRKLDTVTLYQSRLSTLLLLVLVQSPCIKKPLTLLLGRSLARTVVQSKTQCCWLWQTGLLTGVNLIDWLVLFDT